MHKSRDCPRFKKTKEKKKERKKENKKQNKYQLIFSDVANRFVCIVCTLL